MKLEELLKNEKEKRDSLYEKIKFSESIEEIRGIQVEIAKSETEIKKLKETIEERNKIGKYGRRNKKHKRSIWSK